MYSKAEAFKIRERFWTKFGQYMQPVPFSTGEKLNWVNYKTGVKGIRFTMQAESKFAAVEIQISHPDHIKRKKALAVLDSFIPELQASTGTNWIKEEAAFFDGKHISVVRSRIDNLSVFRESDWPLCIGFFKSALIAFDQLWPDHKDIVEMIFNAG
jgi:hypothetical protein